MQLLCLKMFVVSHCLQDIFHSFGNIYWATTVFPASYWIQVNKLNVVPVLKKLTVKTLLHHSQDCYYGPSSSSHPSSASSYLFFPHALATWRTGHSHSILFAAGPCAFAHEFHILYNSFPPFLPEELLFILECHCLGEGSLS